MYCPNCGKLNEEGDQYCAFCGAPLVDNQNFPSAAGQAADQAQAALSALGAAGRKLLALAQRHKKVVAGAAAAIVAVAVAGGVLSARFSARGVAERYFKAMMGSDAAAAYACLDIVESAFTSEEKFAEMWEQSYAEKELFNYSVEERRAKSSSLYSFDAPEQENSISHTFDFTYYLRGDATAYSASVTVVEGAGGLPLMKNYKVLPDFQLTGYEIVVPRGSSVLLDGLELAAPEVEDDRLVYRVPALFTTAYDLTVENPLCETVQQRLYPEGGNYQLYDIPFSGQTCADLGALAASQFDSIMTAILAYGEMPADIQLSRNSIAAMTYTSLRDRLVQPAEGTGLYQFTRTAIGDDSSGGQTVSGGEITYTCDIEFDFTYSEVYRAWDNELVNNEGRESSGYGTFYYTYEDGAWGLEDFALNFYL